MCAVVDTFVAASPAAVWTVLTDFDGYPAWNPFVIGIDTGGAYGRGALWHVTRVGTGGRPATIDVVLDTWKAEREFAWVGGSHRRWQLSGRHSFVLIPADGGTVLRQAERVHGLWALTRRRDLQVAMREQFGRMNEALRLEVESGTSSDHGREP
ncbi:hypothetical protein GCM10009836_36740 [Pseudonocardia ailaonensis]|uniref:Polyketide cyclase n=1 Tax=Pseudonocardia ailaonensis TaxID=367279 RepID=A0ABN2N584_9PSEU